MARALAIHEGIIRRGLIKELEEFRAAGQRVTSYYIDLDGRVGTNTEANE